MSIKNNIKEVISTTLDKLNITYKQIEIDIPNNTINGDYASNIALVLAKELHKNPLEIANLIKDNISSDLFTKIEVANPGFINFFINKESLLKTINEINKEKNNYGKSNFGNNKKINIEFVSANPTGTLHIGHGRGATYGDNLARILSFTGYNVTKEYYINDAGNQMNNLGISIKERYKELCQLEFNIPENGYHGKEIIDIAKKIYDDYQDNKLEENTNFFKEKGLDILLEQIKKDLDKFRVNFDVWTSEQSLYDKGKIDDTLNKLKTSNKCYISEGALWLKTAEYGDEKDRVMIKSDGNYTYFLPDVAYHIDKFNRGYDTLITVLGSDHHGTLKRVEAGLQILGYDISKLEYKLLQMVRIIKDGQEIKLSKRTGKTITLNDLIEEAGVNATRYIYSSKSLDTQMDFDLDLATKESNENPVFYIEYANARICSILKNYKKDIELVEKYSTLDNELTYIILNKLNNFEDIVISAGEKRLPHLITNYVYELASLFHTYYASEKIISEDEEYTKERIAFLNAIKIVINNSLNLIGIIPREEM